MASKAKKSKNPFKVPKVKAGKGGTKAPFAKKKSKY